MSDHRLSALFFRQPRLLVLTLSMIAVTGLSAWALLPRAEDPTLKGRVARVLTPFPGASPERIESLVTDVLEEQLLEITELRQVRSESRSDVSFLLLELEDSVDEPSEVWSRLRDKIDDAAPDLPPGAGTPDFEELEIRAFTVIVALTWREGAPDHMALGRLGEELEELLRGVPGTDDVEVFGRVDEEILVDVEPATLSALGRSAGDVAAAVAKADAKVAAGRLRGDGYDMLLEVQGEVDSIQRLREIPIRQGADGRVVRLGDMARVHKGVADPASELALIGGRPGVTVSVRMRDGERIDRWSAGVREVLDAHAQGLPEQVAQEVIFDQSRYTEARLSGLTQNLVLGVVLVVLVLLVLMGWRSALLVGLALPLATLMVLAGMRLLEVPMHQMSITGLIIALGLLIDNAIVMVDEVEARLRRDMPVEAAIGGAVRHLAIPLLSSTVTTALAFMPMVLMPGPAGEFVGAIGLSVVLALASSLFLALTVIPALRGLLARASAADVEARPRTWWRDGVSSERVLAGYRTFVGHMLERPLLAVVLAAAIPAAGMIAATQLPEQFFPPSDRDQLQVELLLPTRHSLPRTRALVEDARRAVLANEQVSDVHWFVGRTAPKYYYNMLSGKDGSGFYAQGLIQLKGAEGSQATADALQDALDAAVPEAQAVVKLLEQGPPFDAPIEVHLLGPEIDTLRTLGDELRGILAATPHVTHTRASLQDGRPKLFLRIDEEEARLAGLANADLARELQGALAGSVGGSLLEGREELPVRVRVARGARLDPRGIESMGAFGPVRADGARRASPVMTLADLELAPQLATITRRHGQRTNTIQGFLRAGILPSESLAAFEERLAASEFELPPGYTLEVGGESKERDRAVGNLLASVGVLLVLMVATLVLSFNSFRQASIIAAVGALSIGVAMFALWLFGSPFGFMAIVGTMGLIGVAINDAIVVLAALREDPAASQGDPGAVREVVIHATRHVVATTLTTVAGFLPLIVAGEAFWYPLAVAVAGGVAGATLLALTFVPSAFVLLVRLGMRCPLRQAAEAEAAPEPVLASA